MTLLVIPSLSKLSVLMTAAFIISLQCVLTKYASYCLTPDTESGICMPVKSCSSAYSTIKNLPNLAGEDYNKTVHRLRSSACGYEHDMPHVCCPENDIQMNPDVYGHLSQLNCGVGSIAKISHGEQASLYDFRWSALLMYDGMKKFRCGGSLINERYVLTAAHCTIEAIGIPHAVRLGEYNVSTEIDCVKFGNRLKCSEPHEDIDIEEIFVHEGYIPKGLHNDIALIRLVRKVEFKRNIKPVCLPITKELQMQENPWYLVAGWGRTEYSFSSNVLLYTSIPQQPREFCRQHLRFPANEKLTLGHICAGGNRFYDTCKGDSGSALFIPSFYADDMARSIQFGIVSLGVSSCGQITAPAIYTNVSHYMQWITDHMTLS